MKSRRRIKTRRRKKARRRIRDLKLNRVRRQVSKETTVQCESLPTGMKQQWVRMVSSKRRELREDPRMICRAETSSVPSARRRIYRIPLFILI